MFRDRPSRTLDLTVSAKCIESLVSPDGCRQASTPQNTLVSINVRQTTAWHLLSLGCETLEFWNSRPALFQMNCITEAFWKAYLFQTSERALVKVCVKGNERSKKHNSVLCYPFRKVDKTRLGFTKEWYVKPCSEFHHTYIISKPLSSAKMFRIFNGSLKSKNKLL